MAAIVGVILSYATLVTGLSGPVATSHDVCVATDDVCELATARNDGDENDPPRDRDWWSPYATPAEVDCQALRLTASAAAAATGRSDGDFVSGACSQPTWNFGYRVSRFADAERPSGAFGPQRGRHPPLAVTPHTSTWRTPPLERGRLVSSSLPPLAMYATPRALGPSPLLIRLTVARDAAAPSRVIEPPERPPRA